MKNQKIKIILTSFDYKLLQRACTDLVAAVERTGASVVGPVPLPNKIERFTVIRGPHVDKDSREQFEINTHKRLVIINYPTKESVDALSKVDVPAGVEVEIKLLSY